MNGKNPPRAGAPRYGVDILLRDQAGGLDIAPKRSRRPDAAAGAMDIGLAREEDNVVQALALRLRVRRGELAALGWPGYGSRLHELIGEPIVARTLLRVQAFAREALERDPRVAKVVETRAHGLPSGRNAVRLVADVRLIDSPSPIHLSFDISLEEA